MSVKAVVSSKGQIVIPKTLRNGMGLHAGSELVIHLRKDKVLELQLIQKNIEEFFGKGASPVKQQKIIDIDEAIAKAVIENDRR